MRLRIVVVENLIVEIELRALRTLDVLVISKIRSILMLILSKELT